MTAEWQGMLIGYEVVSWFKQVQAAGLISDEIEVQFGCP